MDLFETGKSGMIGAFLGTVASIIGFKVKVNGLEKRVDHMRDHVVYTNTCDARYKAIEKKLDLAIGLLRGEKE